MTVPPPPPPPPSYIDVWITSDMNMLQCDIADNEALTSVLSVCQIVSLFHMCVTAPSFTDKL